MRYAYVEYLPQCLVITMSWAKAYYYLKFRISCSPVLELFTWILLLTQKLLRPLFRRNTCMYKLRTTVTTSFCTHSELMKKISRGNSCRKLKKKLWIKRQSDNFIVTINGFSLKVSQGLLVDYTSFPQKLTELLSLCLNEERKESPK